MERESPEEVMPEPRKYPRTYHLPFSPGTTSDDRIASDISSLVSGNRVVMTEKLDGENTCINARGVFARSHGAPTRNPWASYLWEMQARWKSSLKTLELFGESVYAVHSIKYSGLPGYFFLFAVRDGNRWLAWEEVREYAEIIGVPTVPVLYDGILASGDLRPLVEATVAQPSRLSSSANLPSSPTEGVVIRIADSFDDEMFPHSVYKWVRRGHVITGTHWTRNWERAFLGYELEKMGHDQATEWLLAPIGDAK